MHNLIGKIICVCLISIGFGMSGCSNTRDLYFYGSKQNDLYRLLEREGYHLKDFDSPAELLESAPPGAGVLILAPHYPKMDSIERLSEGDVAMIRKKELKVYLEYPAAFPGLKIPSRPVETHLERAVVTKDTFGKNLKPMDLLGIQNSYILSVKADSPLIVLAKVVGFDSAVYGLKDTKSYPLLFYKDGILMSMTGLSNFETGRYGPQASIKEVWKFILSKVTGKDDIQLDKWIEDVQPMFGKTAPLPKNARRSSIIKAARWFDKGRFFVDSSWKDDWLKYGSNGLMPVGPPVSQSKPSGDGTLGVIEGHTSTIFYDGTQQYRYWMRADVQGEVSMAMAAAGNLLNDSLYRSKSNHLIRFLFGASTLRMGEKNNPSSPVYGLLGWATTNGGTFYGDDNARSILGVIAASAYLHTNQWDQPLAEAIMGNFRTTGRQGFRGERLEAADIIKNGWPYYFNRDLINMSPHFESWLWACYLWLYDKTGYAPLLNRTRSALKITMDGYPDKWLWGSSMQTQRARMLLPLAWLVRVEDTPEHRAWLDKMVNEILKYQDQTGAIREEIGKGKGKFKALNTNADYGSDEGSLIYKNGDKAADMLYTCNFALFGLNEAAKATGVTKYKMAADKLSDFLTRIQVQSKKHQDLDGAWLRGFDFGRWDYWASNSDAGWGAWCTLTGWIQSWILTTQIQMEQNSSFWDITKDSKIKEKADTTIHLMLHQ